MFIAHLLAAWFQYHNHEHDGQSPCSPGAATELRGETGNKQVSKYLSKIIQEDEKGRGHLEPSDVVLLEVEGKVKVRGLRGRSSCGWCQISFSL